MLQRDFRGASDHLKRISVNRRKKSGGHRGGNSDFPLTPDFRAGNTCVMFCDHRDQGGNQHSVNQFFSLDFADFTQEIHDSGHESGGTGSRSGHDEVPGGILLRRGKGKGVQQNQKTRIVHSRRHRFAVNLARAPFETDRTGQNTGSMKPAPHGFTHRIKNMGETQTYFRLARAGQCSLIFKNDPKRSQTVFFDQPPERLPVFVTVRNRIHLFRRLSLPLNKAAADRIISFFGKQFTRLRKKTECQCIAVRMIMFSRIEMN